MTRANHTGIQTADVTQSGAIETTELEKREHRRVALRVQEDAAVSGSPEIGLQVSVDGDTWVTVEKQTGLDFDILRNVPEPYVRATVSSAGDAGSVQLWIATSN